MADHSCPEDGHPLVRDTRPMKIVYLGRKIEIDMPGWYCDHCGEGVIAGKDMAFYNRALNRVKAEVNGLLLPENVKSIRKRLNISQKDAGTIIGGGPSAFQKYESGEVLVSKAISSALVLLDNNPDGLDVLKSRNKEHQAGM